MRPKCNISASWFPSFLCQSGQLSLHSNFESVFFVDWIFTFFISNEKIEILNQWKAFIVLTPKHHSNATLSHPMSQSMWHFDTRMWLWINIKGPFYTFNYIVACKRPIQSWIIPATGATNGLPRFVQVGITLHHTVTALPYERHIWTFEHLNAPKM